MLDARRSERLDPALGVGRSANGERPAAGGSEGVAETVAPEDRTHLDPVRLARWIKSVLAAREESTKSLGSGSLPRVLFRWEKEKTDPVRYVDKPDEIMVLLGLAEWEIPDECWTPSPACEHCGKVMWDAKYNRRFCEKLCQDRARNAQRRAAGKS